MIQKTSIAANALAAAFWLLNPNIGIVIFLMNRCSYSAMLVRYLGCRILIRFLSRKLHRRIPALFALPLSIFTVDDLELLLLTGPLSKAHQNLRRRRKGDGRRHKDIPSIHHRLNTDDWTPQLLFFEGLLIYYRIIIDIYDIFILVQIDTEQQSLEYLCICANMLTWWMSKYKN